MPFVEASDGTQLFYNDWGAGKPVVLIHGWPVNADMWEYQTEFLVSNGLRVISYDRRGFGRSGKPWSGYTYDTMADDLAALLSHLNLTGATLVGFSMGGGEVARYLSRHGTGRIAKVALISSVLPFLLQTHENPDGVPQSVFDKMIDGLRTDRPSFLATFGKQFYGAGMLNFTISSELLQWTSMLALQASRKATLDCVTAFSATDFRPDLKAFTVPTLIVHGSSDSTVPLENAARRVADALPDARFEVYEGAPHGLYFTEKDRLNADLLDFIR
jgi:pimeloyl-ACP methyl ester carboxylesterase